MMSFLSQNAPSLVPSSQGFWLGSHRVQSWLQGAAGLRLLLLSSGALQAQSGSEQPGEIRTARESNRPGQSITSLADGSRWHPSRILTGAVSGGEMHSQISVLPVNDLERQHCDSLAARC
jgi:hypothetical protein